MNKEDQEFYQYLKDWESQMLILPKQESSPESKKGGDLFDKLWHILKALLEHLGGYFCSI